MAAFPSVDLTDFDLAPAVRSIGAAGSAAVGAASGLVKEATYTAVGLGLLTYQRAQVRRRELERARRR